MSYQYALIVFLLKFCLTYAILTNSHGQFSRPNFFERPELGFASLIGLRSFNKHVYLLPTLCLFFKVCKITCMYCLYCVNYFILFYCQYFNSFYYQKNSILLTIVLIFFLPIKIIKFKIVRSKIY